MDKVIFPHLFFFMRVATVNQRSSGDTDRTVPVLLAKCDLIQDYRLRNGHFTRKMHLAYSVSQWHCHGGAGNLLAAFPCCFPRCLSKAALKWHLLFSVRMLLLLRVLGILWN